MQTVEEFYKTLKTPREILDGILQKVKVSGNGWASALCPFHDDANASFSIHLSSGAWKCHTESCGKSGAFFDLPGTTGTHVPIKSYKYTEEKALRYLKVRYYPKTFRTFGVKDGVVLPHANGTGNILYNWDNVKNRIGDIYVVEGEKDVDSLMERGVLAVTGGSSSVWSSDFTGLLSSRKVYLLPDADDAGQKWVQKVCQTLKPEGVISFPDPTIKDITEWFESGRDFKGLILRPTTQLAKASESELIEFHTYKEPDKVPDLVKGLVPTGFITVLYGDGGEGKSYLSLVLAHDVALGRDFLGRPTVPGKVLYLDWELGPEVHAGRAYNIARADGLDEPPPGIYYMFMKGPIIRERDAVRAIVEEKGVKLVVIDSCVPACQGSTNDSTEIVSMFSSLLSLGVTVLLIDHVSKIGEGGETYKPFGSVFKYNLARSVIKMIKESNNKDGFGVKIMQFKNNMAALNETIHASFVFDGAKTSLCPAAMTPVSRAPSE